VAADGAAEITVSNSPAPRGARILATQADADYLSRLSSARDDGTAF
jgi:hypothetical protein